MKKISLFSGLGALAFGITACFKPESEPAPQGMPAELPSSSMSSMPAEPAMAAGPVQGVGRVTAIDAAAGTVTLDHEAINAISWPAMTMKFKAEDPSILKGIATGDHVTFELKSANDSGIVTMLKKQ